MNSIDLNYFPGFTRKSITFSIDDGNVKYDKIFLDIVNPNGFRGAFNLCSDRLSDMSREEYVKFYFVHEIANHVKYHPYVNCDGAEFKISDEPFDKNTSDHGYLYKTDVEGLYHFDVKLVGRKSLEDASSWRKIAFLEHYKKFVRDCYNELKEIFPNNLTKGFVLPFGYQNNKELMRFIKDEGYSYIRYGRSNSFDIPERMKFMPNATHLDILSKAEEYEKLPDDGKLKMFTFGVHSIDFENSGTWQDLAEYAEKYGNRPQTYWYATPSEIFDMADAIAAAKISDGYIVNDSDKTLYGVIDGKRVTIPAYYKLSIDAVSKKK